MTTDRRPLWNDLMIERWLGSTAPAIVDDDRVISGQQLLELASGASSWFDEMACPPGHAIPALVDESATSIAMMVGGALSRRPLAPLGPKLPVDDLSHAVRGLGADVLFVEPAYAELGLLVADRSGARRVVVGRAPEVLAPLAGTCSADDGVVVVHTSGTTGRPKPIVQCQGPVVERVAIYQELLGIRAADRFCSASPYYHTASVAMDVTVLALGAAVIPQDWFSVENWRRAGRLGMTVALLVPTMLDLLLEAGALRDARPRVMQYGAMPIHPDTLRRVSEELPETELVQVFGQTEVSPIARLTHADHQVALASRPELLRSVGRPVPGTELRIADPDQHGIGEVMVSGPHIFTDEPKGWRASGDLGRVDDEGFLHLHGRVNDRIVRGGENILPAEVERIIEDLPDVREAAVVGVPDKKWGEIVKAVVMTRPGASIDAAAVRDAVRARAAHFKVPEIVEFADDLPRNPAGKVLRRALRDQD